MQLRQKISPRSRAIATLGRLSSEVFADSMANESEDRTRRWTGWLLLRHAQEYLEANP
jgi:hypothetical protein